MVMIKISAFFLMTFVMLTKIGALLLIDFVKLLYSVIRTNLVSLYLSDNLIVNLVEIAAKYSLYCFKKMLCSDGEVAESSLLLCKFKEAYVASTCLVSII